MSRAFLLVGANPASYRPASESSLRCLAVEWSDSSLSTYLQWLRESLQKRGNIVRQHPEGAFLIRSSHLNEVSASHSIAAAIKEAEGPARLSLILPRDLEQIKYEPVVPPLHIRFTSSAIRWEGSSLRHDEEGFRSDRIQGEHLLNFAPYLAAEEELSEVFEKLLSKHTRLVEDFLVDLLESERKRDLFTTLHPTAKPEDFELLLQSSDRGIRERAVQVLGLLTRPTPPTNGRSRK